MANVFFLVLKIFTSKPSWVGLVLNKDMSLINDLEGMSSIHDGYLLMV